MLSPGTITTSREHTEMNYPTPIWAIQSSLSFSNSTLELGDIAGAPSCVIASDETLYVAYAARGLNARVPDTTAPESFSIVVARISPQGVVQWIHADPLLVTTRDDTEPTLVLGPSGELYIAFTTAGAIPGTVNMRDTFSFCPDVELNPGDEDVVLARIDPTASGATVAWRIQNSRLNSRNSEHAPQLAIDGVTRRLYLTYETSASIQCQPMVGRPNVVLTCFSLEGQQLWFVINDRLNSNGINQNPVVAADSLGGVYVALETTKSIAGGAPALDYTHVDVVKFNASGVREWVLSSRVEELTAGGRVTRAPSIVADTSTGDVYLAYLAAASTGTSTTDLVVMSVTADGRLRWRAAGDDAWNPIVLSYTDCMNPQITIDSFRNVYVSLGLLYDGASTEVAVWRLQSGSGLSTWGYSPATTSERYKRNYKQRTGADWVDGLSEPESYTMYMLSRTGAPNAVFGSSTL